MFGRQPRRRVSKNLFMEIQTILANIIREVEGTAGVAVVDGAAVDVRAQNSKISKRLFSAIVAGSMDTWLVSVPRQ